VLRSDEIRKRLCGVPPLERLGPGGYAADISREVYATAARHAGALVRAGHSAIVDAVFANAQDRAAIERVAANASVPFVGLWLDAPSPVLIDRTERRGEDPSDATADVVRLQLTRDTGSIGWLRIDAAAPAEVVLEKALNCLPARSAVDG